MQEVTQKLTYVDSLTSGQCLDKQSMHFGFLFDLVWFNHLVCVFLGLSMITAAKCLLVLGGDSLAVHTICSPFSWFVTNKTATQCNVTMFFLDYRALT